MYDLIINNINTVLNMNDENYEYNKMLLKTEDIVLYLIENRTILEKHKEFALEDSILPVEMKKSLEIVNFFMGKVNQFIPEARKSPSELFRFALFLASKRITDIEDSLTIINDSLENNKINPIEEIQENISKEILPMDEFAKNLTTYFTMEDKTDYIQDIIDEVIRLKGKQVEETFKSREDLISNLMDFKPSYDNEQLNKELNLRIEKIIEVFKRIDIEQFIAMVEQFKIEYLNIIMARRVDQLEKLFFSIVKTQDSDSKDNK